MSNPPKTQLSPCLLDGYVPDNFFDEMVAGSGAVQPHYARFRELFQSLKPEEFAHKRQSVDLAFMRQIDISFALANAVGECELADHFPHRSQPCARNRS